MLEGEALWRLEEEFGGKHTTGVGARIALIGNFLQPANLSEITEK